MIYIFSCLKCDKSTILNYHIKELCNFFKYCFGLLLPFYYILNLIINFVLFLHLLRSVITVGRFIIINIYLEILEMLYMNFFCFTISVNFCKKCKGLFFDSIKRLCKDINVHNILHKFCIIRYFLLKILAEKSQIIFLYFIIRGEYKYQ